MLRSLSKAGAVPPQEGKLANPDIPERGMKQADREVVRDKFYTSMRLGSSARNVAGYSLARSGGLPNLDPKKQSFLLEGSIDPANIRRRQNPGAAPPNSYAQGAQDFGYVAPEHKAHNSIALVQKARQSYAARLNRLQPQAVPVRDVGSAVPMRKLIMST